MQLLVLVGKEERKRPAAVLVICPLKSIIGPLGQRMRTLTLVDLFSHWVYLQLTLSFPARADWIRLDRSCAAGFRGGIGRTIRCLQALFPLPPPPLPMHPSPRERACSPSGFVIFRKIHFLFNIQCMMRFMVAVKWCLRHLFWNFHWNRLK